MTNGTALANVNGRQLPDRTHLGDRMEIAAIRQRMASMMQLPADVPDDVIWAAAQLSAAHRLDPFIGEIYIIDLGSTLVNGAWVKRYGAHVGVKGLRTIARRQANFMTEFEVMESAEVKAYRRETFHPEDIGVRCTLWRLDVARECKDLGIPYRPVTGVGFWRRNAVQRKNEWKPDNIPNTWSAQQVAEKRAEVNAIKQAFDLALDIADPALENDSEVIEEMNWRMKSIDRDRALPANAELNYEDDGNVLWATEPTPAQFRRVQSQPEPEVEEPAEVEDEADPARAGVPDPNDDNPFDLTPAVEARLEGKCAKMVSWCRSKHAQSNGPATKNMYQYVSGVIDKITGNDVHRDVLAVLVGRHVNSDNPPGYDLVSQLLDWLPDEITVEGQGRTANPNHKPEYSSCIRHIGELVMQARGQGTLGL